MARGGGGGDGLKQQLSITGDEEVRKAFESIGAAGQKAFSDIDRAATKGAGNLNTLSGHLGRLSGAFDKVKTSVEPIGQHFSTLHERATAFGGALGNIAGSIIPRFNDLLAVGTVGGAAGFLKMIENTAKWGHELELNSQRLGMTPTELNLIGKAAREAGVEMDKLVEGLSKFSIALQGAAEKQDKTMRGLAETIIGKEGLAGSVTVFAGSAKKIFAMEPPTAKIEGFDKAIETLYNHLKGETPEAFANISFEQFRRKLIAARKDSAEAKQEIDDQLSKLGAKMPGTLVGDALRRSAADFKDAFAKLGIDVFDRTTGQVRNTTDALGDFLEVFKTLSSGHQAKTVREMFGRGFGDLIPIMQQGRAGLLGFVDALKASGVDTSIFDEEVKKASELNKALIRFSGSLGKLRNALTLPLADIFTPMMDSLTKAIASNQPAIHEFALGIKATLEPIFRDITKMLSGSFGAEGEYGVGQGGPESALVQGLIKAKDIIVATIDIIKSAFNALVASLDPVAAAINAVFGTELTGQGLAIGAAVFYMVGGFNALATAMSLIVSVGTILAAVFGTIGGPATLIIAALVALGVAAVAVYTNWDKITAATQALWDKFVAFVEYLGGEFAQAWKDTVTPVQEAWTAITQAIGTAIDTIIGYFQSVIDWAGRVGKAIRDALAAGGAALTPQFPGDAPLGGASGGLVRGPGSATSDSIAARLSDGEFVMRTAAVRHWGPRFMSALNALRNPLGGYAMGGLVSPSLMPRSVPRFAGGGLVSSRLPTSSVVNLMFPGGSFTLRGDNETVGALTREARRAGMLTGGRRAGVLA